MKEVQVSVMPEYDFLKILDDHSGIYKDFLLPVVICDTSFEACWSNSAAKNLYPHLTGTQGIRTLLGEFDLQALLEQLTQDRSLRIDGVLGFSDVRLNLIPMTDGAEVAGVIVFLVGSQAVVTPQEILQSSKTLSSLEKSIRQSVESIFKTMDETAYKANMFESGWIKSSFSSIAQSSYHILRIAANISSYTQFQSHPPLLSLASRDVFELLRQNELAISGIAKEMGVPIRFDLPDTESVVGIDIDKIRIAFYNVLHNSLYFTKPGNEIEIIGESDAANVSLTVRDKGVGISAEVLPQIFKPYFSSGHIGKAPGVGLGLPLAKMILEAHGGSISVRSAENEGCETTLTIPKNIFSRRISLGQRGHTHDAANRFSFMYVGLADAAGSPYRE